MMTANGLAKLLEELGELSQIAAKRLAYFHVAYHPDGAGNLNERMQEEMADVSAACAFVVQKFRLDGEAIAKRAALKLHIFQQWDAQNDNAPECFHAAPMELPVVAWQWFTPASGGTWKQHFDECRPPPVGVKNVTALVKLSDAQAAIAAGRKA